MKPEDVPDELTRAAMEGHFGHAVPDGGFAVLKAQWQRAVAAVLPAIQADERAKVAADIEADLSLSNREMTDLRKLVDVFAEGDQDTLMDLVNATGRVWLRYAARVARGEQP